MSQETKTEDQVSLFDSNYAIRNK